MGVQKRSLKFHCVLHTRHKTGAGMARLRVYGEALILLFASPYVYDSCSLVRRIVPYNAMQNRLLRTFPYSIRA